LKKREKGMETPDGVVVIVLAGGEGTRLWPLTQHRCKSAVGFGGKYRLIDIPISNALNSNINNLFIISQYFAPNLHQHILSTYHGDLFHKGSLLLLSPKKENGLTTKFQGTADAIRKNLSSLTASLADYFLILSGDQLYNMNLKELIQFAINKQAKLVVASLYVTQNDAKRMGVLRVDQNGLIKAFCEKPKDKNTLNSFSIPRNENLSYLASMGIYVFRRDVLFALLQKEGNDFGYHLIPNQMAQGDSYAYIYDGYWADIGTITSFYEANMALLDRRNCLNTFDEFNPIYTRTHHLANPFLNGTITNAIVSQGSIIESAEIEQSILGMRCHLQQGSKIYNSILMGSSLPLPTDSSQSLPFSIGKNCIIKKAIIDENSSIGNNVRLLNEQKLEYYNSEHVCIRNGIIVVKTGAHLVDGFTI